MHAANDASEVLLQVSMYGYPYPPHSDSIRIGLLQLVPDGVLPGPQNK